jgi:hypothetical protein
VKDAICSLPLLFAGVHFFKTRTTVVDRCWSGKMTLRSFFHFRSHI